MRQSVRWLTREAGIRFLARRKAACAVGILTMALALGANTLVFSVTKAFLLNSFALPEPDRVFVIAPVRELPGRGEVVFSDAYANYRLIRETQRSFADVAVFQPGVASWDDQGEARPLQSARVSSSFFSTTTQPHLGRGFRPEEEGPTPAPVAVISYALWQSAFSGASSILGETMLVNGSPHSIVGVMPAGFTHPLPTDLWLPFTLPTPAAWTSITGARSLGIYGRLKAGVSVQAAAAETTEFTRRALEASPDNRDFRYTLQTIRQVLLPGADRTLLFVQAGAILLVLLAVSNLASLLIAWGFDRRQEIAVRLSLGSRNGAVVRMLLLQSLVVVCAGGLAGLLLARAALPLIRGLDVTPALGLFLVNLRLDAGVLLWSALAVALAGLLAGALPAWFAGRANLSDALRSGSRSASLSPAAVRWQKGMVFAQASLSVMILAAATLIGVSFRKLSQVAPGYDADQRIVARIQMGDSIYTRHPARVEFATRLLHNLSREPELASYAFTSTLPVGDQIWGGRFYLDPADAAANAEPLLFQFRRISPGYTETMGIPLLRGRALAARDDTTGTAVALISNALAKRLWPNSDAVGKYIYRVVPANPPKPLEIIGVLGDVTDAGFSAPVGETVYVPFAQISIAQMSIVVTSRTDEAAAFAAIRRALKATDPMIAANNTATVSSLVRQSTALPRLQTILLLGFALVALSMVVLGSYGVMSQVVASREKEFALRLLFGASPTSLGGSVLFQVARLSAAGTVIGIGAVWLMNGILQPLLFGVQSRSLGVLAAAGGLVLLLTALAALPPAARAMRVNVQKGIAGA